MFFQLSDRYGKDNPEEPKPIFFILIEKDLPKMMIIFFFFNPLSWLIGYI